MATSFSPARLFSRTGRLGSRHQKKRSCESTDSQLPGDRRPSTASEWTATDDFRHSPNGHVTAPSPHRHYRPRGDDTAGTMKASLGLSPAFQGLPPSLQLDSHSFMEDDELRALGITTREEGNTGKSKGWRQRSARARCGADKNLDDVFEMEVPIQVARDKRPDLQVSIPQVKTARSKSPRLVTTAIAAPTPQSAISTSSLKSSRPPKSGTTGTPLSIVSPLSVVEMPKPQRPFSAESIEGLASQGRTDGAGGAPQSASTESAAPGQRKFADRGRRPSTASVGSETDILLQQAGGLAPPTVVDATALRVDTATLYHAALVSTPASRVKKEQKRSKTSPTPNVHYMRRQTSSTSLTTNNTMNINKPLPPEPGRPGTSPLKHIAYSTSITHKTPDPATPSRSNSTTTQKKKLTRGETASPDSPQAISMSRKNSRASLSKVSLRSKFTPKDLDAMDDAFQRRPSINNQHFHSSPYSNHSSPSHSQISLTIDTKHLQTITENSPRSSDVRSLRNEPVQISRGPMRMEPTRRPPQPPKAPQRVHTIAVEKVGRRKPSMTRSASNTKLKTQENGEEPPARRSSTNVAMSKAEKILGRMGPPPSSRPEVRPSFDFSWGASDSPRDYIMTESPAAASEEENDMPELEARHNAQEMEIRRRLALLSAKDDPSTVFEALHKDNSDTPLQRSIDKNKELSEKKPTIEDKLHLTGSLRNEINVPTHIAELEAANRTPSPAELEGSNMPAPAEEPAELGLSSPAIIPTIPIPPEPDETSQRRGRFTTSDPHSTASGKSSHSQRSIRVRSLASLAASDIPDMYASLPTPNQSVRPSMSGEEVDDLITADAAERVLLHILQSLDNLEDLFAASMVSKGFYRTFKRHELYLLKRAIWRMSPSAWELREMSIPYSELPPGAVDYTPHLYFRHYVQDLLTMVEIKAMILESCKSFLRLETISGLAGETERSPMIDEAFWRVWTFCRIFGCGNSREDDIVGQMDWLKGGVLARQSPDTRTLALTDELARNSVLFNPPAGFAKGNGKGLSSEELYDMYEIWTCLGVLVRGYQGKRQEARDYGVFDRCDVPRGDEVRENAILEEWTHHLLTLAPSTVLDVTSPATPTHTQFAQARSQGYTTWNPPKQGASRSTFLKEAVSRVYEEQLALKRSSPAASPKSPSGLPQAASPSIGAEAALASRARIARHAAEIKKRKDDPNFKNVPVSDDRPLSNYSDVLDRLEAISTSTDDAPPMPKLPGLAARLRHKSKGKSAFAESTTAKPQSPAPSSAPSTTSFTPSSPASIHPLPSILPTVTVNAPKPSQGSASTVSSNDKDRLKTPKPTSNQTPPSRHGAGRFSSLREHIAPRRLDKRKVEKKCKQTSDPQTPIEAPDEKLPVHPNAIPNGIVPLGPQVRDPVDLAVEKLVEMGFDEARAKQVLAQTESGNGINFQSALQRLSKEKERKLRLERLQTMG